MGCDCMVCTSSMPLSVFACSTVLRAVSHDKQTYRLAFHRQRAAAGPSACATTRKCLLLLIRVVRPSPLQAAGGWCWWRCRCPPARCS
jgi:hypothetical protein